MTKNLAPSPFGGDDRGVKIFSELNQTSKSKGFSLGKKNQNFENFKILGQKRGYLGNFGS